MIILLKQQVYFQKINKVIIEQQSLYKKNKKKQKISKTNTKKETVVQKDKVIQNLSEVILLKEQNLLRESSRRTQKEKNNTLRAINKKKQNIENQIQTNEDIIQSTKRLKDQEKQYCVQKKQINKELKKIKKLQDEKEQLYAYTILQQQQIQTENLYKIQQYNIDQKQYENQQYQEETKIVIEEYLQKENIQQKLYKKVFQNYENLIKNCQCKNLMLSVDRTHQKRNLINKEKVHDYFSSFQDMDYQQSKQKQSIKQKKTIKKELQQQLQDLQQINLAEKSSMEKKNQILNRRCTARKKQIKQIYNVLQQKEELFSQQKGKLLEKIIKIYQMAENKIETIKNIQVCKCNILESRIKTVKQVVEKLCNQVQIKNSQHSLFPVDFQQYNSQQKNNYKYDSNQIFQNTMLQTKLKEIYKPKTIQIAQQEKQIQEYEQQISILQNQNDQKDKQNKKLLQSLQELLKNHQDEKTLNFDVYIIRIKEIKQLNDKLQEQLQSVIEQKNTLTNIFQKNEKKFSQIFSNAKTQIETNLRSALIKEKNQIEEQMMQLKKIRFLLKKFKSCKTKQNYRIKNTLKKQLVNQKSYKENLKRRFSILLQKIQILQQYTYQEYFDQIKNKLTNFKDNLQYNKRLIQQKRTQNKNDQKAQIDSQKLKNQKLQQKIQQLITENQQKIEEIQKTEQQKYLQRDIHLQDQVERAKNENMDLEKTIKQINSNFQTLKEEYDNFKNDKLKETEQKNQQILILQSENEEISQQKNLLESKVENMQKSIKESQEMFKFQQNETISTFKKQKNTLNQIQCNYYMSQYNQTQNNHQKIKKLKEVIQQQKQVNIILQKQVDQYQQHNLQKNQKNQIQKLFLQTQKNMLLQKKQKKIKNDFVFVLYSNKKLQNSNVQKFQTNSLLKTEQKNIIFTQYKKQKRYQITITYQYFNPYTPILQDLVKSDNMVLYQMKELIKMTNRNKKFQFLKVINGFLKLKIVNLKFEFEQYKKQIQQKHEQYQYQLDQNIQNDVFNFDSTNQKYINTDQQSEDVLKNKLQNTLKLLQQFFGIQENTEYIYNLYQNQYEEFYRQIQCKMLQYIETINMYKENKDQYKKQLDQKCMEEQQRQKINEISFNVSQISLDQNIIQEFLENDNLKPKKQVHYQEQNEEDIQNNKLYQQYQFQLQQLQQKLLSLEKQNQILKKEVLKGNDVNQLEFYIDQLQNLIYQLLKCKNENSSNTKQIFVLLQKQLNLTNEDLEILEELMDNLQPKKKMVF